MQKIAVNCLLEGREAFAVMPTGLFLFFILFFIIIFLAVLHSDRTEEDLKRRVSEQCDFSYFPVDRPD